MGRFNIKSILLGIGIGIILTSIASMIYFAGSYPAKEPSRQEVERLAAKYGLVKTEQGTSDDSIFINESSNTGSATK